MSVVPGARVPFGPWLLAGLLALYAGIGWFCPPRLFWDSAKGFEIWRSMEAGAPFNCLAVPSGDLAKDDFVFVTWWTPGQYAVPGLLRHAGLAPAPAIWLTTIAALALGLWGWHGAWRDLGFDARVARWSSLILMTQGYFVGHFALYSGGEILLFGFCPWALRLALRWREHPKRFAAAFPVLVAAGLFMKASFFLFAGLLMGMHLWSVAAAPRPLRTRGALAGALLASGILALALPWYLFFARGITPGLESGRPWSWLDLAAPLANPWVAAVEGSQALDWPHYSVVLQALLAPVALAGGWMFWTMLRRHRGTLYGRWLVAAALLYVSAFLALYARQSLIDYTARHMLPLGLLLLPGLVLAWFECGRATVRTAGLLVLCASHLTMGVQNAQGMLENARFPRAGAGGYALTRIPPEALARLTRLDEAAAGSNALFALPHPELCVAIRHARIVHYPMEAETLEHIRMIQFQGHVEHLLIAQPVAEDGRARAAAAANAFKGYRMWVFFEHAGWVFGVPAEDEAFRRILAGPR